MSSTSSAATDGSRSSSPPHTPEADPIYPIAIRPDLDLNSWFHQSDTDSLLSPQSSWPDGLSTLPLHKSEGVDSMLHLDDLLEQNAYDDSPPPSFDSPEIPDLTKPANLQPMADYTSASFHSSFSHGGERASKPIPPPASVQRKIDPSSCSKVVFPPKDSCYNLALMFPSLPEGGAKSRVETQIRVTVDLADFSSSADPSKYNRVGSWKWLQLPRGTATKRRTRKQGKIDPDPMDVLHLTAAVTCSTSPNNRVYSCSSCQSREAKRVAKKLAARVRPARSDSESGGEETGKAKSKNHEDTTSIIQFNCAETQDFSAGTVVLPLRITCYCRHHREKVGFSVNLSVMDHAGRIVGSGVSKPIMITDDHKTPGTKNPALIPASEFDWAREQGQAAPEARAPSKRKSEKTSSKIKKRGKPYEKPSRSSSVVDHASPESSYVDTRASTPNLTTQTVASSHDSDSSVDTPATPPDYPMLGIEAPDTQSCLPLPDDSALSAALMPFLFLDALEPTQPLSLPLPMIHRLIPNAGPTHGGTEVTILGANFHESLQLDCVFGDVIAPSTQRWSDNTLVCILPPRATPGVVSVYFNNLPKPAEMQNSASSLFTYSDESDRALMELALQVVGLKMTGKIEDAKNVAMRIVGNVGEGSSMQTETSSGGGMMHVASPFVLGSRNQGEDLETRVMQLLSLTNTPVSSGVSLESAVSLIAPSGQGLLHLAALLRFGKLVDWLVQAGADIDSRDRAGFTPLHFAALSGSDVCVRVLLHAGADREIVNAMGKTAEEVAARPDMFDSVSNLAQAEAHLLVDDEAHWGDAEEESDDEGPRHVPRRRTSRRLMKPGVSGKKTPRSVITPRTSSSSLSSKRTAADDKHAANLFEMIQRTLAQLPAPQLRNLPGLAQLPEMPAWGALPHLTPVFPVLVPWPAFLGAADEEVKGLSARAVQEIRAWEKWIALALTRQQAEEAPPPMYTPREPETVEKVEEEISTPRQPTYPPVTEQEVDSFAYVPTETPKKHDRMLLFFWLPILMISILWAMHSGLRIAFQTIKGAVPLGGLGLRA
ncbi:unnamed protein product [Mycena citricolor]|uniref:IPT/TIG domain-containing protein n=1 Tax=Mycena citricolor TaxID=2018698 RepID=A0AAD2GXY2_9AGAR|nr:unnamed protein product [Mycena citricolor]CAK5281809.1 unnamed protein product [Mycena citricolor]